MTVYTYRTNFPGIYESTTRNLSQAAATNYSTTLFLGGQTATASDSGLAYALHGASPSIRR